VTVAKCCWVVTVNRQTGEATTDLWDDDDTAWHRSLEVGVTTGTGAAVMTTTGTTASRQTSVARTTPIPAPAAPSAPGPGKAGPPRLRFGQSASRWR
jgi:hypothetical protein